MRQCEFASEISRLHRQTSISGLRDGFHDAQVIQTVGNTHPGHCRPAYDIEKMSKLPHQWIEPFSTATRAITIGAPGWPEFAVWTASIANVRMVLIES